MSQEIEEVKSRIDILDLIGKYITLKKSGINYAGLCPFHQEKTPSFMVNPERQSFKCFGCGEGGDVITFLMKIEGLEFYEALKMLAEQVGFKLKERSQDGFSAEPTIPKTHLYELNSYLANLWHQILVKHPRAQIAGDYLKKRQLTDKTIAEWQIGFAPPRRTTLDLLAKKGFSRELEQLAGSPSYLENRITFPIYDLVGKVVGFTGRIILENASGPKYWNTRESAIFHKSRIVYGLDKAKSFIKEKGFALLVEGQMDVITLHQAGFQSAIATSGTSFTAEHLKIIKRFSNHLTIAFDQDEAGQKAAEKAIETAFTQDIIPDIVLIPSGKDPAEAVLADPPAWQKALDEKQSYLSWLIERAKKQFGSTTGAEKKEIVKSLAPWLTAIPSPVEKDFWLKHLASEIQVSEKSLLESLAAQDQKIAKNLPEVNQVTNLNTSKENLAIGLISRFPQILNEDWLTEHRPDSIKNPLLSQILAIKKGVSFDSDLKKLPIEMQKVVNEAHILASDKYPSITYDQAKEEIMLILKRLDKEALEGVKDKFAREIAQAEKENDLAKVKQLIQKLQDAILNKKLN